MNALRLFSGIGVVLGCHASLFPASTLPLSHAGHLRALPLTQAAGHLPGLTSYAANTLSHHAHIPAATPYAQGYQNAAVAPITHINQHLASIGSYAPQTLSHNAYNAIAPSVQTTQHHSQDELGQYDFGYSGGPSSRQETGDAYGNVRGSYSYVDAYGQIQKQSYVADEHGFRVVGTNIPTSGHHHLGKRSIASFPASTGPLVGHHAVAPIVHATHAAHHAAPVVHSGHHVAHAVPVAHHAHSHHATHYTSPGAHVSHVASLPSNGHGYGHNHGGFSYGFSAASPVYGYAHNQYAHAGHHHLGKRSIASFPASTGPLVGHHAVAPIVHATHAAHHVAPVVHSGHHVAHAAHHVAPVVHRGHHVAHAAHHVAPVVHSGHHVAHAVPVAHHAKSHHATHYTSPGAHVSHLASLPSRGYGHNHGAFSYGFSAASPVYGHY